MSVNKRIVHELSVEDLVKIATSSKEEIVMDKVSEAAKFIYAKGIRAGESQISAQLVYWTYKQYKGWRNNKQSKAQFFRDFNKYFKPHRTKHGLVYFLEDKVFDTSQEAYWLMRKELRDEKQAKKIKNKKRKSSS